MASMFIDDSMKAMAARPSLNNSWKDWMNGWVASNPGSSKTST